MATEQITHPFTSNAEGWVVTGGTADTTLVWSSTGGNTGGCISSRIRNRNKTADPNWVRSPLNWAALGLPAGATITGLRVRCDWRCSEWNVGNTTTAFRYAHVMAYNLSANAWQEQASAVGPTVSGTTSYATIDSGWVTGLSLDEDGYSSLRFEVDLYLRTANNSAAAVTLLFDNVIVDIEYTEASGQVFYKSVSISSSVVPSVSKAVSKSGYALAQAIPSVGRRTFASKYVSSQVVPSVVRRSISTGKHVASQVVASARKTISTTKSVTAQAQVFASVKRKLHVFLYASSQAVVSAIYQVSGPSMREFIDRNVPAGWTSIQYRVAAKDSTRQSDWTYGNILQTIIKVALHIASSANVSVRRSVSLAHSVSAEAVVSASRRTRKRLSATSEALVSATRSVAYTLGLYVAASVLVSASKTVSYTLGLYTAASALVSVRRKTSKNVRVMASALVSMQYSLTQVIKVALHVASNAVVSVRRHTLKSLRVASSASTSVRRYIRASRYVVTSVKASIVIRYQGLVKMTLSVVTSAIPSVTRAVSTSKYASSSALASVNRRVKKRVHVASQAVASLVSAVRAVRVRVQATAHAVVSVSRKTKILHSVSSSVVSWVERKNVTRHLWVTTEVRASVTRRVYKSFSVVSSVLVSLWHSGYKLPATAARLVVDASIRLADTEVGRRIAKFSDGRRRVDIDE